MRTAFLAIATALVVFAAAGPAAGARRRRAASAANNSSPRIEAKPGARLSELAAEIGIASGQVSALLAKVRAEKLVVKKGVGYALKK